MGFTIGSRRAAAPSAASAAALAYGTWCGWAVVPGARTPRGGGPCTCRAARCPAPAAHPLPGAPELPPGAGREAVEAAWAAVPDAPVLLPVGRSFDVIEVGERAGRAALARLERLGLRPGPVALGADRRARFLVAPGAAAGLSGLLYRTGWDFARLDLRCLGAGSFLPAPCGGGGTGGGGACWLRAPDPESARRPPEARSLLGTLAAASHRASLADAALPVRPLAGAAYG
jgi:hypothetical protein